MNTDRRDAGAFPAPSHEQQLFVEVDVRVSCSYCGLHKARLILKENRAGSLEPWQWGTICPHTQLVFNYRQNDAIARGKGTL